MLVEMGKRARLAARLLGRAGADHKNRALSALSAALLADAGGLLAANRLDLQAAQAIGLSPALLDRLALNPERLQVMADDLRRVADLPDPVGETFDPAELPNGLQIHKQRVPLGVLGVIYEARPNVTVDVAGLALKTGNAAILRGGSETLHSNRALVAVIRHALAGCDLPPDAIQFIDDPDRTRVMELLQLHEYVDLLIPRGGASLHRFCREHSRIPVITGGIGICHLFVDRSADLDASQAVIFNAKVQRPSVCNALDTVLVHRGVAAEFLPALVAALAPAGVAFRAAPQAFAILQQAGFGDPSFRQPGFGQPPVSPTTPQTTSVDPQAKPADPQAKPADPQAKPADSQAKPADSLVTPAGPDDFDIEWLSLVLGLKVVDGLDQAIEHIAAHSTGHSDGILTADAENARRFVAEVDSAAVYVNASTRFTDGGQLGLGAEVAISTQRLHARGPMGLRELTTYKWVIRGDYHVRP